jgi:hypothetical protein
MDRQALADRRHDGFAGGRDFEYGADRLPLWQGRQQRRIDAGEACREDEFVIYIEADDAFAKTLRRPDELPDRDGIEKLVCDDEQETFRHIVEAFIPCQPVGVGGKRFLLDGGKARAGLHQMHLHRLVERWRYAADDAQHVGHHRAATGADFHQLGPCGRTMPLPGMNHENAEHLAKKLAYLRRGDEIT